LTAAAAAAAAVVVQASLLRVQQLSIGLAAMLLVAVVAGVVRVVAGPGAVVGTGVVEEGGTGVGAGVVLHHSHSRHEVEGLQLC
jgi:hypothetical protein